MWFLGGVNDGGECGIFFGEREEVMLSLLFFKLKKMVKNKHKKLWWGAAKMFNIIFLRTENNVVRAVFVLFLFLFHQPFLLFQHLFASFISGLRSFRFYARFGFTCCLATFVGFRWILRNLLGSCAVGFGHLDKKKLQSCSVIMML